MRLIARLVGQLEPWLLLFTRVRLAQAFLTLQLGMLMAGHSPTATLAGTWWIDTFRKVAASGCGAAIQALCPVLLILGLAIRPAALLLILQVALLQQGGVATLHSFWAILLLCLIVRGAGRISLAAVFARGMATSALPGVRFVVATRLWLYRRGTPILLLLLRLVIAAVLLDGSGTSPAVMSEPIMHAVMAMLPPTPAIILGALALVLGVGVRPIAILLMILAPIGGNTIATDALYWLLMLGFLAIDGAGVLAVDTWLDKRLRGMIPAPRRGAHHVVIVGGGFGGCVVAQGLAGRDCSVTLIDRHNTISSSRRSTRSPRRDSRRPISRRRSAAYFALTATSACASEP